MENTVGVSIVTSTFIPSDSHLTSWFAVLLYFQEKDHKNHIGQEVLSTEYVHGRVTMKDPLLNAFEIGIEDIQQVAKNHHAVLTDKEAEVVIKLLDQKKIASVALDGGNSLEEQTDAAYGEIKRQMLELKPFWVDLLLATNHLSVNWEEEKKEIDLKKLKKFSNMKIFRESGQAFVICSICKKRCVAHTAHIHQDEWIGDECCWDERLRSSE